MHKISQIIALALLAQTSLTPAAFAIDPHTLPHNGSVVSGQASIHQSGAQMDINQQSNRAIVNWQTFDVGRDAQVNFHQPSSSAVILNRVTTGDASQIHGRINANGQVYLVNPSGVLFSPTARVDVGGLVASTHTITDENFLAGKQIFERNGATGSVINQGTITTAEGGTVALIAPNVSNQGTITANKGNVALASGDKVRLQAGVNGHLQIEVDGATLSGLVQNGGFIQADGGQVVMTSEAAQAAYSSVVSNTGTIRARTLENREGRILLLADMEHGKTIAGGVLDASAPETGNGGFVETSAAKVKIKDSVRVNTKAETGKTGTWLIDPEDVEINTTSTVAGATLFHVDTLQTNLATTDIAVVTSAAGAGSGDIFVNAAINWAADTTLTLSALRDIQINQNITATGDNAGLVLEYGTGRDYYLNNGARITLSGAAPALQIGQTGNLQSYTIIHDLTALQAMNGDLAGHYALGNTINATASSGMNGGLGFAPVGTDGAEFTGTFHGLGNTISGLTINRSGEDYVGLFGAVDGSTLRDVIFNSGSITGNSYTGILSGLMGNAYIRNVVSNATVNGDVYTGGLIGLIYDSTVEHSHTSGNVSGDNRVGGLIGDSHNTTTSHSSAQGDVSGDFGIGGLIGRKVGGVARHSSASGEVTAQESAGGLIGWTYNGQIEDSYATGNVNGIDASGGAIGGLLGVVEDNTRIYRSYATGDITSIGGSSGGLLGHNNHYVLIEDSYALGNVTGTSATGGLVGYSVHGSLISSITNSYATGAVNGTYETGGLVGDADRINISNSYATGNVTGSNNTAGGLLGYGIRITLTDSYATGNVSGYQYAGGLAGSIRASTVTDSYATGTVYGTSRSAGGLIGRGHTTNVSGSYATGNVTSGNATGGLMGESYQGSITNSYATGTVSGNNSVGGLLGLLENSFTITNSYATGAVTGVNYVGGLVGYNPSYTLTISNAYSKSAVSGVDSVGGLVGYTQNATITNTYSNGAVSGTTLVGGLIGNIDTSTVNNSFWDTQTSGQLTSAGGTGITTAQSQTLATFSSAGWDIAAPGSATVWYMIEGETTPLLYGVSYIPLTITAADHTITYDGNNFSGGNGYHFSSTPDVSLINGVAVYGGDSQGARNAGTYTLTLSGLTSDIYDIRYVDGVLTIDPAALNLNATGISKVYDGTTTATVSISDNRVLGDTIGYTYTAAYGDKNAASGKTITVDNINLTGADAGNYYLTSTSLTTTGNITPRSLTVTAHNKQKTEGSANPPFTYALGGMGLVAGDSIASVFSGGLSSPATTDSPMGNYTIGQGSLTTNGNYTISQFNNGILNIIAGGVEPTPTDGGVLEITVVRPPAEAAQAGTISHLPLTIEPDYIRLPLSYHSDEGG